MRRRREPRLILDGNRNSGTLATIDEAVMNISALLIVRGTTVDIGWTIRENEYFFYMIIYTMK